jgi:hypothetical protein
MPELTFSSDYRVIGTAEKLNRELVGFRFNGPGWYKYRDDTVLVIPNDRPVLKTWHRYGTDNAEVFIAYVYNGYDPQQAFGSIAQAPVRTM